MSANEKKPADPLGPSQEPSTLAHRLSQRLGFTGLTLAAFGVMDVTFKCLVIPAYVVLIAEQAPVRSAEVVRLALRVAAVVMALWFGGMVVAPSPITPIWCERSCAGSLHRR